MCKLFVLTNAEKLAPKTLEKLLKNAAKILTPSDKDGFGWAAAGSGGVFGERYVGVNVRLPLLTGHNPFPDRFRPFFKASNSETFGTPSRIKGALIVHARYSTNTVSLENSHPHRNDKYTLIHNGVVKNQGETYAMRSTCDTEHMLHHLSSKGIHGMVKNVTGYYAVAAIDNTSGNLTLVKDNIAHLYGCYIKELESLAFSTSAEQLSKLLRSMKWKHDGIDRFEDNLALEFDRRGEVIRASKIVPEVEPEPKYESRFNSKFTFDDLSARGYTPLESEERFNAESRMDDQYTFYKDDTQITYAEFEALTVDEQAQCEVVSTETGHPVKDIYAA